MELTWKNIKKDLNKYFKDRGYWKDRFVTNPENNIAFLKYEVNEQVFVRYSFSNDKLDISRNFQISYLYPSDFFPGGLDRTIVVSSNLDHLISNYSSNQDTNLPKRFIYYDTFKTSEQATEYILSCINQSDTYLKRDLIKEYREDIRTEKWRQFFISAVREFKLIEHLEEDEFFFEVLDRYKKILRYFEQTNYAKAKGFRHYFEISRPGLGYYLFNKAFYKKLKTDPNRFEKFSLFADVLLRSKYEDDDINFMLYDGKIGDINGSAMHGILMMYIHFFEFPLINKFKDLDIYE